MSVASAESLRKLSVVEPMRVDDLRAISAVNFVIERVYPKHFIEQSEVNRASSQCIRGE